MEYKGQECEMGASVKRGLYAVLVLVVGLVLTALLLGVVNGEGE